MRANHPSRRMLWSPLAITVVLASVAIAEAQQHRVVFTTVHSAALEGSLLEDSPDRKVTVYLPAEYDRCPEKRFPVVYLLHGYTGTSLLWTGGGYCGPELHMAYLADEAFSEQLAKPMILVAPDCSNKFRGSWYRNSPVTGGWETFVTRELVEYVDSTYRTLADRDSRGLAGHSMGGHGAMLLAMKHPEIYGVVYAMAPAVMAFETDILVRAKDRYASLAARGAEVKFGEEEWQTQAVLALAAAVAPNTGKPPYYGDLPLDGEGSIVEATWRTWLEHDPRTMLKSYCANLKQLNCIRIDSGQDDAVLESARLFSQSLTDHGVPHVLEEFQGNHTDQVAPRLRDKVLPFFSDQLKFE